MNNATKRLISSSCGALYYYKQIMKPGIVNKNIIFQIGFYIQNCHGKAVVCTSEGASFYVTGLFYHFYFCLFCQPLRKDELKCSEF